MTTKKNALMMVGLLVIVSMILSACAPAATAAPKAEAPAAAAAQPTQAPAAGAAPTTPPPAAEASKKPLIIGWGGYSSIDDGDFGQMMYNVMKIVEEHFGDQIKNIYAENIPVSPEAERTFEQFIADGATLLIDTTDFADATENIAKNHPDIIMEKYAGWVTNPNQRGWWFMDGKLMYLHGVAAGMLTKTNQLGFIGPWPAGYVKAWVNAFTLGAQSVNPDVTVNVVMIGSFMDPPAARQATEALIASGVDVISGYSMEPTIYQVAEQAGVWALGGQEGTGNEGIKQSHAPTKFVTCLNEQYQYYFIEQVQKALDGTWTGNMELTMLPISDKGVDLCPFGPNVPQEVKDKVLETRQQLIDGQKKILGPITDDQGNLVVADGVELTDNEFWLGMDWVVKGVKGMEE